jgi:hypothetical protein
MRDNACADCKQPPERQRPLVLDRRATGHVHIYHGRAVPYGVAVQVHKTRDPHSLSCILKHLAETVLAAASDATTHNNVNVDEIIAKHAKHAWNAQLRGERKTSLLTSLETAQRIPGMDDEFVAYAEHVLHGGSFFVTERGLVGLAAGLVEVRDQLVALLGCHQPVLFTDEVFARLRGSAWMSGLEPERIERAVRHVELGYILTGMPGGSERVRKTARGEFNRFVFVEFGSPYRGLRIVAQLTPIFRCCWDACLTIVPDSDRS